MCQAVHQIFSVNPVVVKIVHVQGYDPRLIPVRPSTPESKKASPKVNFLSKAVIFKGGDRSPLRF